MKIRIVSLLAVFCWAQGVYPDDRLDVLNVLGFGSEDAQMQAGFNCNVDELQHRKKVQHCKVVITVYTEDTINPEPSEPIRKDYAQKSEADARKIAGYYCDATAEDNRILQRKDLLAGRRSDLQIQAAKYQRFCTCKNSPQPGRCLASAVGDAPEAGTICEVSAVTVNYLMSRQPDGSWTGQPDKDDSLCSGNARISIRQAGSSFGFPDYEMKWTPQREETSNYICKILSKPTVLRHSLARAQIKPACDKIQHVPVQ